MSRVPIIVRSNVVTRRRDDTRHNRARDSKYLYVVAERAPSFFFEKNHEFPSPNRPPKQNARCQDRTRVKLGSKTERDPLDTLASFSVRGDALGGGWRRAKVSFSHLMPSKSSHLPFFLNFFKCARRFECGLVLGHSWDGV